MNIANNRLNIDIKSAKILLVDDEAANIKLLERILAMSGFTSVVSTQDPRQVLAMYLEHAPDIILLDLNMPHMDGYDVLDQLHQQVDTDLPPILVLTAQYMQEHRQKAFDKGASDYVTKPFDTSELLSRVSNLLEVHLFHKLIKDQNQMLEQKVEERTRELRKAHKQIHDSRLQIVRRLGRAAEYRDNETGLHIIRMSKMASLLARAAGMDEAAADLVLNASPMHDIGKIGIPDNILLKPGKFEADEWEIMKTHAQIGADILSGDDSPLLSMAREIALTHHEKWDGSGYPNGLRGEDIPLVGRITALADVFDALTSERPYKKAWTVEDALNLIREQSGKHFDPALVEAFEELLPEIIKIKEEHAEPTE
ncbi:MAG: response regulator [Gammaproteobacteria bacterium]|nr:response regulator [Gammaproteobacteria bacterium]